MADFTPVPERTIPVNGDMETSGAPPQVALLRMMTGYWVSQSVYIAAKLGIADLLHAGPKHYEEIAAACLIAISRAPRSSQRGCVLREYARLLRAHTNR
jgi:hypothetical protein